MAIILNFLNACKASYYFLRGIFFLDITIFPSPLRLQILLKANFSLLGIMFHAPMAALVFFCSLVSTCLLPIILFLPSRQYTHLGGRTQLVLCF